MSKAILCLKTLSVYSCNWSSRGVWNTQWLPQAPEVLRTFSHTLRTEFVERISLEHQNGKLREIEKEKRKWVVQSGGRSEAILKPLSELINEAGI